MENAELLEQRECFGFYRSWWKALKCLPNEQKLLLFDAILEYSFTGVAPELPTDISQALWESWLPTMKRNMLQYLKSKKGGAPKGNQNARKQSENNPETTRKQANINININRNTHTKIESATFVAPTLQDVKDYCFQNNLPQDVAEHFFYYYDKSSWKTSAGANIENWKSALRGWIAREPDFKQKYGTPYKSVEQQKENKQQRAADYAELMQNLLLSAGQNDGNQEIPI